ncbi:ubiquinol-cytochrome c reductase complex chaperone CBP3-like, partial [Tropilaelaps mercedesae]
MWLAEGRQDRDTLTSHLSSVVLHLETMFFRRAALSLVRTYATASKPPLVQRIKKRFEWAFSEQPRLARAAVFIYETSVDNIDTFFWIKHFKMADTYLSWFLITE